MLSRLEVAGSSDPFRPTRPACDRLLDERPPQKGVGEAKFNGAHNVEPSKLIITEGDLERTEVVLQLDEGSRAQKRRRDSALRE